MSENRKQYFLDTETTGFLPHSGDRIVEIGIVEYMNRFPTGRTFHVYLDPERDVPEEAVAVHNLTRDDLVRLSQGKKFKDIAYDLVKFVEHGEVIAHNAKFDIDFINAELAACGMNPIEQFDVIVTDSLRVANAKHPQMANNLDALCKRHLGSDNYKREYHGALLDASLLGQVYILMTVTQNDLSLDDRRKENTPTLKFDPIKPLDLPLVALGEEELARHAALVKKIEEKSKTEVAAFAL